MPEIDSFEPDWFSPPGQAVAESLRRSGKPLHDFMWEMDFDEDQAQRLFDGRLEVTDALAHRLETTLGVSATFWSMREAQYRRDMVRIAESVPVQAAKEWLRDLPLKDMTDFGWIERRPDQTGRVAECLRYFDIPSVQSFEHRVDAVLTDAKLRTSQSLKSKPAALMTWLRKGEIEAEGIACKEWNPTRLEEATPELRKLTLIREPQKFLPQLRKICSDCGVALVIARAPSGCRASGATKFLSDDKALLLLSFRHLTDDHFWFSFFHECGHLLLHGKDKVFIEGEPHDTEAHEQEADEFAERTLVPDPWHRLLSKLPPNKNEVIRFAVRAGVSPGIIVGQLQHRKRISHNYLNYLKRRFVWL
jgi:Zn-dependent peptidase ImmA (M78 family)/plasmid maintenance system antidote protein VapI